MEEKRKIIMDADREYFFNYMYRALKEDKERRYT